MCAVRNVLFILLLLIVLLSFVGCGDRGVRLQGEDTTKFSPYGYEALFTHGNLPEIEIVISQEEWDAHIQDMKDYAVTELFGWGMTGTYRKAKFIYKGPAGDAVINEVGFRTTGHGSRIIPQDDEGNLHRANFKINFDETFDLKLGTDEYQQINARRFCSLRSLILRLNIEPMGSWETSQISELYCYDLLNKAGVYTCRTGSTRLTITIDGESHYFGIYTILEPIDKSFLTARYGKGNNDGNLYKCLIADSGPATLEPIPDPVPVFPEQRMIGVKDWEAHYRPTYDLKTNTDKADHTVLLDFIERLNALEGDKLKEYLDDNFEVDRFLRCQVINVILGKWDDYWTVGDNYYLYFNNNGKIEFIPYDYHMVLGQGNNPFYNASTGIYEFSNQAVKLLAMWRRFPSTNLKALHYGSPLIEKMLEIDEYRAKYEQYFKDFITPSNKLFLYSEYEKKFNSLYELYAPYLDNDLNEGEEMINDGSVEAYFLERTKSVVDELGLNEEDYETKPTKLGTQNGVSATDKVSASIITVKRDILPFADYYRVYRSDSSDVVCEQINEDISGTSLQDESKLHMSKVAASRQQVHPGGQVPMIAVVTKVLS